MGLASCCFSPRIKISEIDTLFLFCCRTFNDVLREVMLPLDFLQFFSQRDLHHFEGKACNKIFSSYPSMWVKLGFLHLKTCGSPLLWKVSELRNFGPSRTKYIPWRIGMGTAIAQLELRLLVPQRRDAKDIKGEKKEWTSLEKLRRGQNLQIVQCQDKSANNRYFGQIFW